MEGILTPDTQNNDFDDFKDINPKNEEETFEIKIDSYKVEQLLELLQKLIIEFLKERYHPEK